MNIVYRQRSTGSLHNINSLRRAFPHVGWADEPDVEFLDFHGIDIVKQGEYPTLQANEKAVMGEPELTLEGWEQNWMVVPFSTDELQANTAAQWEVIRHQRDEKLRATDFHVIRAQEGIAISADMLAYRQALRDITEQADPFNILWPLPPT